MELSAATGRGREPLSPEGGTPETPGHVQPHSLLRESVTGRELHRHWAFFTGTKPCFISPDEGPALRHPRPPLGGVRKPGRHQGAKGTPVAPSATTGPLPGEGSPAPPRQRAYLRGMPHSVCRGEGPGSRPLSCSPQHDPPAARGAIERGPPAAAVTCSSCDTWLA